MASLFPGTAVLSTVDLVPGKLKKEITRAGSGPSPQRGQTVTAHYTGKLLNGKTFDSSVSRGRPFQFKIGIGQVRHRSPRRRDGPRVRRCLPAVS